MSTLPRSQPITGSMEPKVPGRRKRPRVPPEQRKRVKIACENCRKNKLKCNGETPCGRCAGSKRQCQYLEVRSPTVPCHPRTGRDDRLHMLERIFAKLHPDVPTDSNGLERFYSSSFGVSPADVHQPQAEPLVARNGDDVEPDDDSDDHHLHPEPDDVGLSSTPAPAASMTVINQGKTHFEGKSSYWSFFNSVRQVVIDDSNEDDEHTEADCNGSIHQSSSIHFSTDWKTAVLSALPPRGVVDFLVTTFFRFAQGNYFYIHPEIFSRKLTAFYNGTHEFVSHDSSSSRRSNEFICVLFMVFAIGSQFADVGTESDTRHQIEPWSDSTNLDFSRLKVPVAEKNPGWRFYEVSKRLLSDVICSSSMTSIQVCVLQGIFLPSTTSRDAGYNLLGLALRMAVNMGMHRSFGAGALHPHVRELRNRLWWSVYVAERLFSVEMGRPLSISDAEIDALFPVDMPEWNLGTRPMNIEGLIAMVKLCRVFGRVVETVYCKPAAEKDTIIRPKVFRQLKRELEQCREDLPDHLKLGSTPSRAIAHLALTYEQGTILLTRSCLNCATVTNQVGTLKEEARKFLRRQAQDCMNSAIESIRIMSLLKSQSLLCRFSFHDSLYCSAALYVLLLVEKLDDLVQPSREVICQGVMILLDLAKGSEAAASSLRHILRGIQSYSKGTDDHPVVDLDGLTHGDGQLRGRMAWKAWMTQSSSASAQKGHGSTGADFAEMANHHDSPAPRGLLNPEHAASMTIGRLYTNDPNSPAMDQPIDSPSLNEEHRSEISDLQPFWIPEYPDFDVLGRDLGGAPDLPTFGQYSFL